MGKESPVLLSRIIQSALPQYQQLYGRLSDYQWKVISTLQKCGTADLGMSIYRCDTCGDVTVHYHSCRNRHCPKCQGATRGLWIENRKQELLPVGYYHIIFTVPQELRPIMLRNKDILYAILFQAASQTLLTLGRDKKYLNAIIGFMAVLHTWGQTLIDHPHLHIVIPAGGIRLDKEKWAHCRKDYLFPQQVVAELYRGKFLSLLKDAVEKGNVTFRGEISRYSDPDFFSELLGDLWKKKWMVYLKPPCNAPQKAVEYLGRYTSRIAISEKRLISHDDGIVKFRWKDYRQDGKEKIMVLTEVEFLRRFLLHIVPQQFVRIRYYGFMSNRNKEKNLERCMSLLNVRRERVSLPTNTVDILMLFFGIDVKTCKKCNQGHRQLVERISNAPPFYRAA